MGTSCITVAFLVLVVITATTSLPQRAPAFVDFGDADAETGNSDAFAVSPGIISRPNGSWDPSATTEDSRDGSTTREPENLWGTTEEPGADSGWRGESSTLPSTTGASAGRTTTLRPQDLLRHRSCGVVPSPGECQAAFPRYFYNESTSQCDCYIFGGCDEGEGSYGSLEECHRKCHPENKEEGPSCKFVYVDFSPDTHTTTAKTTTVQEPEPGSSGTSRPLLLNNATDISRNQSQNDLGSPAQEFPSTTDHTSGFSTVTTISPTTESQNDSTVWSSSTTTSRTQSTSSVTEEDLHWSCQVYLRPGDCEIGFPRYYYNHTSSQCNCYNYTVCGESDSYGSLEECVKTCNPIFKDRGPSCPVPPVTKSGFRPLADADAAGALSGGNGTTESSSSSSSNQRTSGFGSSSSSWNNEVPVNNRFSSAAPRNIWSANEN